MLYEGNKKKMIISEEEMEGILEMYSFVEGEGQETTSMYYLVKRIETEKRKWKIIEKRR